MAIPSELSLDREEARRETNLPHGESAFTRHGGSFTGPIKNTRFAAAAFLKSSHHPLRPPRLWTLTRIHNLAYRNRRPAGPIAASENRADVLVGSLHGGELAIDFTLQYPKMVQQLVLVGAVVSGMPYSNHFLDRGIHNSKPFEKNDKAAGVTNWADGKYVLRHRA